MSLLGMLLFIFTTSTMPIYVDEIVVTGEAVEQTATVEKVTAEKMEATGVKTVSEALEQVPGVYISEGGKGMAMIQLRGFDQREVSIMINGVPISQPYDGSFDLNNLPVESIDQIEVVKGAGSLLYGSNAMGGTVNIITKKSDGHEKFSFNGEYGSGKAYNLGSIFQGGAGSFRYLLSASYQDRDYFTLSDDYKVQDNQDDNGERANSDRQSFSVMGSAGWDFTDGQLTMTLSHADMEKGIPHHESDSRARFWRYSDWKKNSIDTFYQKTWNQHFVKAKLYYDDYEDVLDSYDDATYTSQEAKYTFTSSYDDYSMGGDFTYKYTVSDSHLIKLVLRPRKDEHREQGDSGDPWMTYNAETYYVAFENEWTPIDELTVVYGTGYDMMTFDELDGGSNNTDSFLPQVSLLYKASDKINLRLSASRKTRFPTLKELYSDTSGNPDLTPMKSNIYEGGIDLDVMDGLSFSVVGFFNDVIDLIDRQSKDDPYMNISAAEFSGIEVQTHWIPCDHFDLTAGYSYLDSKDKSGDSNYYIEYRPKHKIDWQTAFRFPMEFGLNINGSYVSSQSFFDGGEEIKMDAYNIINVRASKKFGGSFEVYALAKNILDELYYEIEGYPLEGRSFFGGIRVTL